MQRASALRRHSPATRADTGSGGRAAVRGVRFVCAGSRARVRARARARAHALGFRQSKQNPAPVGRTGPGPVTKGGADWSGRSVQSRWNGRICARGGCLGGAPRKAARRIVRSMVSSTRDAVLGSASERTRSRTRRPSMSASTRHLPTVRRGARPVRVPAVAAAAGRHRIGTALRN